MILPIIIGLVFSFTNYDLYKSFDYVGISNYQKLLADKLLLISLKNTFIYCLYTIIPGMAVGLLLALVLNINYKGVKAIRTVFYMPYVISMMAASMIWLWLFDPTNGIINKILEFVGIESLEWLYDKKIAMLAIAMVSIWKGMGYNMIVFMSGINAIPLQLYEAAEIEGAGSFQQFTRITFPLLKPTTFFILVTSTISSFNVFEQVKVLTDGGPSNATTTIVHQIFKRAFEELNMGYASSQAIVLFIIVLIITLFNFRMGFEGNKTEMN